MPDRRCETGPDRIRRAIERDRGMGAPEFPILVCGPECRGEVPDAPMPPPPKLYRGITADWLICPGCIRFKFSPFHLLNRIVGIFKLAREQGYTLKLIPGTPEENAPVFDFEHERILRNAA